MNALNTLVLFPSQISIYLPPPMSDDLKITSIPTEMPAYLQKNQAAVNKWKKKKQKNPD